MPEEALTGGNLNPVIRAGATVRRPTGAWTPAVHKLLKHLEAYGFEGAPRVLGVDDQGREVLTFIEGDTDSSGTPSWIWSEVALVNAARLIRRYHVLCSSFKPPANPHWQVMVGAPTQGDIICHNDLAPFNAVYRKSIPVAFFDWDLAAPGPPLWDIAYAAWRFVPLYSATAGRGWPTGIGERAARLRSFCDAYGLEVHDRARLVQMIKRRIQCVLDTGEAWGKANKPGWSEMWRENTHRDGALADLAYINEHRHLLGEALV